MFLYLGEHLGANRAKIEKLEQVSGAIRVGSFHTGWTHGRVSHTDIFDHSHIS